MPASESAASRRSRPAEPLDATSICPFVLAADGRWRSARPAREHRCTAVGQPIAVDTSKQLEHCLTAAHPACARFVAARTVAAERDLPRDAPVWGFGPTAPILLEAPGFHLDRIRPVRARAIGQLLLGALMVLAFLFVVLARATPPA